MSKKIIIDGVNVKDCRRRFGKNSYCRYFKRPCADNNFNCIWKQHERVKAENEKLKKLLETRCYNEVEFENKKLKEKLYTLRKAYYDEQRERMMFGYKLEKIKQYANQLEIFTHIKEDLLNIVEGAEDDGN